MSHIADPFNRDRCDPIAEARRLDRLRSERRAARKAGAERKGEPERTGERQPARSTGLRDRNDAETGLFV